VKLLFDQNLSPRLVERLIDLFPGSAHVFALDLGEASDTDLWAYAKERGYTLVSKDVDFSEMSVMKGHPPKVLWIRTGNCTTAQIEALLRRHYPAIEQFGSDPTLGILALQ
jgi:predicted nuclease of predicted toxin-antitoxin system